MALEHPIGRRLAWVPFTVRALTGLILLGLDPGVMTRMALFVLSPVAVWKAALEPRLDRMTWIAALFGLLTLLFWELPPWNPTGEPVVIEGVVQAILPGAWAPEAIRPLIFAGVLFAAFHVAAGLWFERRAPRPLHWSALTAAVPVLVLIVLYGHIARFQSSIVWALTALALAAALTGTTAYATLGAAAEGGKQRAGVHAAGAAAALALGCAIMLRQQWLSLAIALFLPALAWIEAQTDLPALRRLALVVAIVVLIRLLGNWYVLDYDYGGTRIANGLIAAYAAPAVLFGVSALLFRRRADDLLVAVLEGGAASLAGVFLSLEIRHWFRGTDLEGPASFLEMALHVLTLGAQASIWLRVARRSHRPILDWAWRILGGLALAGSIGLLVFNPLMTNASAGTVALLIAYVAPAGLAFLARQQLADPGPRRLLGGYALAAGFVWITAQIRVAFHPDHPGLFFRPVEDAELWAWSGAWMLYGMGLMAVGIRLRDRLVRLAALGVIGLVCAKVFLVDMSGLTGLWRVLSFLGLGLALIGLGTVYRRFMLPAGPAMVEPVGPPMPEDPPPAV